MLKLDPRTGSYSMACMDLNHCVGEAAKLGEGGMITITISRNPQGSSWLWISTVPKTRKLAFLTNI